MGSGERGVSFCFTTWTAGAGRFETLNGIASPIVPTGTIRVTLAGDVWRARVWFASAGVSGSCEGSDGGHRLLAEAERGLVAPHPVQARPFARARQQGMGRLVERGAGQLVAAAADLALDIGLARLIAGRCQTKMRTDIPRVPGPLRPVDGGAEGKSDDRPAPWHAHQAPADRLAARDDEDLPGQPVELLQHRGQDRQQRRDERQDQGIVARRLAHPPGKGRTGRGAELDPALAQDRPHHVLARDESRSTFSGFQTMIRKRRPPQLDGWINTGVLGLDASFANGVANRRGCASTFRIGPRSTDELPHARTLIDQLRWRISVEQSTLHQ